MVVNPQLPSTLTMAHPWTSHNGPCPYGPCTPPRVTSETIWTDESLAELEGEIGES